jgi:hypothetical protein
VSEVDSEVERFSIVDGCGLSSRLLPLFVDYKGKMRGVGTAFLISPQLAITAKHVVSQIFRKLEGKVMPGEESNPFGFAMPGQRNTAVNVDFQLFAIQQTPDLQDNMVLLVMEEFISPNSDLVILRLARLLDGEVIQGMPIMELNPPAVGEKVEAFGYFDHRVVQRRNRGKQSSIEWRYRLARSLGTVSQVFPEKGCGISKFPCFTSDMILKDGMSGGPVFNSRGRICGVSSSALNAGGGEFIATSALLWPSMSIRIPEESLHVDLKPKIQRVHDLAKSLMIAVVDWQRTIFDGDDMYFLAHMQNLEP